VDNSTGANTNSGLSGFPWKELPGTVNPTGTTSGWVTIQAGDTINLTAGQEWNKGVLVNSSYYNNGTSENRITIQSSSTTRAIFDFNAGDTDLSLNGAAFQVRRDYITFRYLEVREITRSGNCSGFYIGNADANDYNQILYCYIHDIIDTTVISGSPDSCSGENYSYGVVMVWATGTEIAYNIFKNIDKKFISSSENYGGSHSIHHNTLYNESGFTGDPIDHGIVVSSANGGNSVYNNILWNNHKYYGKNYAINMVESGGSNKIYNNIIRGWSTGIALRTDGAANNSNEVIHNTIYLADNPATLHTCYYNSDNNAGIYLDNSDNNEIKNNIVYYPELTSGNALMMIIESDANNNEIDNNLFYYNGSAERIKEDGSAQTVSWLNSTFSDGSADSNIVFSPGFVGGGHTVGDLPTGFNSNWHPNSSGLSLSATAGAIGNGQSSLGSPYGTDIAGTARTSWDIGAYEFTQYPSASGITFSGVTIGQ
jgi:parallel beta-helix repeat protein